MGSEKKLCLSRNPKEASGPQLPKDLWEARCSSPTCSSCSQTATLYPGVVFGICFVLNCFIWGKHSSGAVSTFPRCQAPLQQGELVRLSPIP